MKKINLKNINKKDIKDGLLLTGLCAAFASVAGFGGLSLMGLSDEAGARKTLDESGFTVLRYDGTDTLLACRGLWRDRFVVQNNDGKVLKVTVCKEVGFGNTTSIKFH